MVFDGVGVGAQQDLESTKLLPEKRIDEIEFWLKNKLVTCNFLPKNVFIKKPDLNLFAMRYCCIFRTIRRT